jgi:uncharacterized protein DUF5990
VAPLAEDIARPDITAKTIATGGVIETRVPCTGLDGDPACATVKDFAGWKAVKR